MSTRTLAFILLLVLAVTSYGGGTDNVITGKFWLSEHPVEMDAPDAIEFRSDGTCLVDCGKRTGILGKYYASTDGRLKIEADTGTQTEYTYNYDLLKYTLVLSHANEKTALFYVRQPEGRHPQFTEILGTFCSHNDLGYSVGKITADYKFQNHLLNLVPEQHTYYVIHMDGKCSYTNGIVTYVPEHSNAPQQDKYLRDFVVKRDTSGLWIVDPFHDTVLCEVPATNLDLPSPPNGYSNGSKP